MNRDHGSLILQNRKQTGASNGQLPLVMIGSVGVVHDWLTVQHNGELHGSWAVYLCTREYWYQVFLHDEMQG